VRFGGSRERANKALGSPIFNNLAWRTTRSSGQHKISGTPSSSKIFCKNQNSSNNQNTIKEWFSLNNINMKRFTYFIEDSWYESVNTTHRNTPWAACTLGTVCFGSPANLQTTEVCVVITDQTLCQTKVNYCNINQELLKNNGANVTVTQSFFLSCKTETYM